MARRRIKKVKKIVVQLKRSEEKFRKLFELSPVGMAMVEHKTGKFREVNDALLDFLGYSKEEFMKMSFWDITPEEYNEQEEKQINDLDDYGEFGPNEKEYIRKDNTRIPIRISGFLLIETDGTEMVWGIIEDITLEKENKRVMENLAFYDPLTGLANRSLLTERFNQLHGLYKRENKKFGVMFIDLDKFKFINDTYGHIAGDFVLKEVASNIKSVTKREEDTVARIGGDEFAVIIPEIENRESLLYIANKISEAISMPVKFEDVDLIVTASIGISIYPDHAIDLQGLLKVADSGMYQVKEHGGNKYQLAD